MINEQNYEKEHFVWCSPVFDPDSLDRTNPLSKIPSSSSPKDIYETLKKDIQKSDRHSAKIKELRAGLNRGVDFKQAAGVIDALEAASIRKQIKLARFDEFKPMLMIIPMTDDLEKRLIKVPVNKTANPLSTEYQITDLRREEFEVIMY